MNHEALRAACFEAARKSMADIRPTDVSKIKRLAEIFYKHSLHHVGRLRDQGCDTQILVRAVEYLAHTHAISPMHDSTEWFMFMLRALLELACPDVEQNTESISFLSDLEYGIKTAREMLDKQPN
ncbi:MAG: hypothetical protein VB050_03135 [Geobacteraceae bacterium]|nr:hypothetical protein [Geobacteraceae bacterium]